MTSFQRQILWQSFDMSDSLSTNYLRKSLTAVAVCGLLLTGCSERKSAMSAAETGASSVAGDAASATSGETEAAAPGAEPAVVQPAP